MSRGDLLWSPTADLVERSAMAEYLRERGLEDYDALWAWSVSDLVRRFAASAHKARDWPAKRNPVHPV